MVAVQKIRRTDERRGICSEAPGTSTGCSPIRCVSDADSLDTTIDKTTSTDFGIVGHVAHMWLSGDNQESRGVNNVIEPHDSAISVNSCDVCVDGSLCATDDIDNAVKVTHVSNGQDCNVSAGGSTMPVPMGDAWYNSDELSRSMHDMVSDLYE